MNKYFYMSLLLFMCKLWTSMSICLLLSMCKLWTSMSICLFYSSCVSYEQVCLYVSFSSCTCGEHSLLTLVFFIVSKLDHSFMNATLLSKSLHVTWKCLLIWWEDITKTSILMFVWNQLRMSVVLIGSY